MDIKQVFKYSHNHQCQASNHMVVDIKLVIT